MKFVAILLLALALSAVIPVYGATELTPHSAEYKVKISIVSGVLNTELRKTPNGYVAHHIVEPSDLSRLITRGKMEITSEFENEIIELENMIDAYLDFARNDREEQMVDASLFKLLQQAAKSSDPDGKQIHISIPPENLPVFPIQVQSIRRALINLFTNAMRYAGKASAQIQIFDDHSEIIIDDNGPGIPRDKREEVVLPFTRLDNSRNNKTGGTGLGLSIAKNAALNHGGELILEDSPLGGLRIRLLLPL